MSIPLWLAAAFGRSRRYDAKRWKSCEMCARDNPFDAPAVAAHYEGWYSGSGRRADRLETALLARLLTRFDGARSALEVGCGTGHFTRWLAKRGLDVTGLDASPAMLAKARQYGTEDCVLGDARALPFPERTFDLTLLITTLEFVPDPPQALTEAVRVARHGVIIGALNRHSVLGWRRQRSSSPLWRSARLFTVRELLQLCRQAAGRRLAAQHWRTTLWPLPGLGALPLPWGGFVGVAVHLKHDKEGARP